MINREDMLELTRRMTPSRTCFDRIAGCYLDEYGEVDESFNIHFGKLTGSEKARNLSFAKKVLFSKTNDKLKEYEFPEAVKGKDSMWMLLNIIKECGLKNDAVMDIFYDQMADGYVVDGEAAIYVYHGVYDIPLKAKDKESLWDSEEVYEFILCTVSPLAGEYTPDEPVLGFLYPAFSDRSADKNKIDIFMEHKGEAETGFLHKMLGKQ